MSHLTVLSVENLAVDHLETFQGCSALCKISFITLQEAVLASGDTSIGVNCRVCDCREWERASLCGQLGRTTQYLHVLHAVCH